MVVRLGTFLPRRSRRPRLRPVNIQQIQENDNKKVDTWIHTGLNSQNKKDVQQAASRLVQQRGPINKKVWSKIRKILKRLQDWNAQAA